MILTHKVIALDEHSDDPFTIGIYDTEEIAQRVADSYNLMYDAWNSLTTAHVIKNNWFIMNYTLKQLQDRVNRLIEQQGEDAHCAAWIYTAEDCVMYDNNDEPQYPAHNDRELSERIFNDVGNIDYIYTVIQECVDESTEEQYMAYQQELVEVEWKLPLQLIRLK